MMSGVQRTMRRVLVVIAGMLLLGTATAGISGVASAQTPSCESLSQQLQQNYAAITSNQQAFNALSPAAQLLPQGLALQQAITNLQAQNDTISGQLAAGLCSLASSIPTLPSLPSGSSGSGSGSVTQTNYPAAQYPQYYDGYTPSYSCGSACTYASTVAAQPVYATQVAAVPTGGVNTGDGSFAGSNP